MHSYTFSLPSSLILPGPPLISNISETSFSDGKVKS